MTNEEIEALAVKHESFGFGRVDEKGYTTHGFSPEGLESFAKDIAKIAWEEGQKAESSFQIQWEGWIASEPYYYVGGPKRKENPYD